ncbi:tRNA methyltransferase ppm2 [Conoideocrella luteorostrata]|uniref:tRNA wybutosine-synthesizing protein 4 n=1 Tax=Conoideocrella luteorostrata TaxID=1105319 RepID=A0AAJ0CXL9_9HYPO|nr:tRNA methyltransferase ppm2 [Conoideocrella luteorostrata]
MQELERKNKMATKAKPGLHGDKPNKSQQQMTARLAKQHVLDELIMGTNSSSIVSKRSVENLYYPNEPHYFRYFVKKFQRRAPLINRGYWLRLRVIDVIVQRFLSEHQKSKRVVINLGCGSDVLPWQSHVRCPLLSEDVIFVDVDYPDLMLKKRSIVLETPQLQEILGQDFIVGKSDDQIILRSNHYCQIGCDLRELEKLKESLEELTPLSECRVLFVAEVSITYMDTHSADELIRWASSISESEFCLLEQLLPCGLDHPFAVTMLKHFDKLNTPPKSVHRYPTLAKQVDRFTSCGFPHVSIWDLWEAWSSESFLTSSERASLDETEPFDEWEEFVMFCRHYFILHASNSKHIGPTPLKDADDRGGTTQNNRIQTSVTKKSVQGSKRRFGDALTLTDPTGGRFAINLMGLGSNGREESCDIYSLDGQADTPTLPITGPVPRMCHTLTDLGDYGVLLVGGRSSPANVFSDCWIFEKGAQTQWRPTYNLPIPLFRHSAICLNGTSLTLVAGGKTGPSIISEDFYVFHASKGWLKCKVFGDRPSPTFGGILYNKPIADTNTGVYSGLFTGGIGLDGRISKREYTWQLELKELQPVIRFKPCENVLDPTKMLSIFGARAIDFGSHTLVCGGVGDSAKWQGQGILAIDTTSQDCYTVTSLTETVGNHVIPFMIGSSILRANNSLVILGGGATCFSMGTFWETGASVVTFSNTPSHWKKSESTTEAFTQLQFVGSTKTVVAHECQNNTERMDFNSKNFHYVTQPFGAVMHRAEAGDRVYMRALSHEKPTEQPANIHRDFPRLATDFCLPKEMQLVQDCLFSSVLRISGRINMWLHYDVMANMYVQIAGSKRMILFPPSDVGHLAFAPGASSSSIDVFSELSASRMKGTHPHEAILKPGDVLFLPPHWLHTATSATNFSIAVNVFFRNLDSGYAAGRDVYGNRDLAAYEKSRSDVARIGKSFQKFPVDIRRFYLTRLADELELAAEGV